MKLAEKAKVYDQVRKHIIQVERELGSPPLLSIPYMPDVRDFDSVRGFYKAMKECTVEHAEWFASQKEISRVRHIFEDMGEDMRSVRV